MELIGMFARRVWLRQHKFDISLSRIDYRSLSRLVVEFTRFSVSPACPPSLMTATSIFWVIFWSRGNTLAIALAHTNGDCEIQGTRFMQRASSRPTFGGNASFNWTRNYSARLDFRRSQNSLQSAKRKKLFPLVDDDSTLRDLSNFAVPSFAKSHHLVNCFIRLIKISFDIVHKLRKLLSFLSSEKSRRSDSEKHLKLTESEASKRKRLIA